VGESDVQLRQRLIRNSAIRMGYRLPFPAFELKVIDVPKSPVGIKWSEPANV
jgi:hypothetical protein